MTKGYRAIGAFRRASTVNTLRLDALCITKQVELMPFDLTDHGNMQRVIGAVAPTEVYILTVQSFVGVSLKQLVTTGKITGVVRLLDVIREVKTPDSLLPGPDERDVQ